MATKPVPPSRLMDITGLRSGSLVARQYMGMSKWLCDCDCGNMAAVLSDRLRNKKTLSCGHIMTALLVKRNSTHRKSGTREYAAWAGMITRCTNPKRPEYQNYGARGISVCDRWRKFENFMADIGPKPAPNYSLDRIDVDGNYEPGNVRWATLAEQAVNKRRNRFVMVGGVKRLAVHVARENGITDGCFDQRVNQRGWSLEDAATTPMQTR